MNKSIYFIFIIMILLLNACTQNKNIKNCGTEIPYLANGIWKFNESARECMSESYKTCEPAKFTNIVHSDEGGAVITKLVVEGLAKEYSSICNIHLYFDASNDRFYSANPKARKFDSICQSAGLRWDETLQRNILLISQCERPGEEYKI